MHPLAYKLLRYHIPTASNIMNYNITDIKTRIIEFTNKKTID